MSEISNPVEDLIRKDFRTKSNELYKKWKKDNNSALINILKFIYFQRERVEKKEISGATVVNYVKSIKLFCDMADIPIH
jgi:hypothetical protein